MTRFEDLVEELVALTADDLTRWVEEGWVKPAEESSTYHFSNIDCARVRMICDIRYTCQVEEETVPLVLSLLDQLYGARRTIRELTDALSQQPEEIRSAVQSLLTKTD